MTTIMRKQITLTVTFDKTCPEGTKQVKAVLRIGFDVPEGRQEGGQNG